MTQETRRGNIGKLCKVGDNPAIYRIEEYHKESDVYCLRLHGPAEANCMIIGWVKSQDCHFVDYPNL